MLIYEQLPHLRSVCTGVWFKSGSRYENKSNNGISHFTEHMVFKGTTKRSARDIADEFDSIGGILNGFTGKEATCYYAKTLDMHFEKAAEILADMVFNSLYDEQMIERERKVILEEMAMYQDSPEDYVHEKLEKEIWKNNNLGMPIIGTKESLMGINREILLDHTRIHMSPRNTVISVAGNFDESKMLAVMEGLFGTIKKGNDIKRAGFTTPKFNPGLHRYSKEIEQTYVSIAFESFGYENEARYPMLAATSILGGGISSRLFQNLREEKGLVYSVGAVSEAYSEAGIMNIYAGTSNDKLNKAIECIKKEVEDIGENGVTDEELVRVKEQLKGNFILGMESTSSRMTVMGKNMLLKGYVEEQDEVIRKIDAITLGDIKETVNSIMDWKKSAVSILSSKDKEG
ncbi:MAG: insulinase family protein [Candidatus Marinimicrobia bacterium]|nr:insulinase family protein [Candidatus Neomarinimicrobiota bacterium]